MSRFTWGFSVLESARGALHNLPGALQNGEESKHGRRRGSNPGASCVPVCRADRFDLPVGHVLGTQPRTDVAHC